MSVEEFPCGLDVALAVMGGKWKPFIMYHIYPGPKRFGDLKRLIAGVSDKVLSQQLRELAVAGVLIRHDHKQVPPVVDYTITAFGVTLARALMPLCEWEQCIEPRSPRSRPRSLSGRLTVQSNRQTEEHWLDHEMNA